MASALLQWGAEVDAAEEVCVCACACACACACVCVCVCVNYSRIRYVVYDQKCHIILQM